MQKELEKEMLLRLVLDEQDLDKVQNKIIYYEKCLNVENKKEYFKNLRD